MLWETVTATHNRVAYCFLVEPGTASVLFCMCKSGIILIRLSLDFISEAP